MNDSPPALHIPPEAKQITCGPCSILWLSRQQTIDDPGSLLSTAEREYAQSYKASARRLEYERTRWLIRMVLPQAGELRRCPTGMPTWPLGWVGSISHKEGHCAIVLERSVILKSVGLDIENPARVKEELENKILRPEESQLLRALTKSTSMPFQTLLAIVFSFKEALFKAHFPLGQTMFYFHDASVIDLNLETNTIAAKVHVDTSPVTRAGFVTSGSFCFIDEDLRLVASVATLEGVRKE